MKPLAVLLGAFLVVILDLRIFKKEWNFQLAGRIAMAIMLVFTAVGHFLYPVGMAAMIPEILPWKLFIVYATGILEAFFAIGLVFFKRKELIAWAVILFFILVLPANIQAAAEHISYQTGEPNGPGLSYLLFRIPLQFLFIGWVYLSAVKKR